MLTPWITVSTDKACSQNYQIRLCSPARRNLRRESGGAKLQARPATIRRNAMNTRRYLTARCRPPVCIVAMAALCVIAAGAVALAVEEAG